jgi:hypothetical protein
MLSDCFPLPCSVRQILEQRVVEAIKKAKFALGPGVTNVYRRFLAQPRQPIGFALFALFCGQFHRAGNLFHLGQPVSNRPGYTGDGIGWVLTQRRKERKGASGSNALLWQWPRCDHSRRQRSTGRRALQTQRLNLAACRLSRRDDGYKPVASDRCGDPTRLGVSQLAIGNPKSLNRQSPGFCLLIGPGFVFHCPVSIYAQAHRHS